MARPSARWVVIAVCVHAALALLLLAAEGDPAWFLHLGRHAKATTLARRVLGPDVPVPQLDGHDGQQFWVLARDPLLLNPHTARRYLDLPSYRADRIGYPLTVAAWRIIGERGGPLGNDRRQPVRRRPRDVGCHPPPS